MLIRPTPPSDGLRVAFVSPCGGGNLGDAAIVESLVTAVRSRAPGAEVLGFTGNPEDTAVRHAVTAFPLRARVGRPAGPAGGASGQAPPPAADPGADPGQTPPPADPGADPGQTPPPDAAPGLRARLRGLVPAAPFLREGWRTAVRFSADTRYHREVAERLRGCQLVVVAGGGQFDELFGGPFRHPYTLWRFAAIAKRVGARFAVLSVGTGTVTPLSRLFLRRVLALADVASFRDQRSRELMGAGTARATVVPDLAYGLAQEGPAAARLPRPGGRAVIGLSPMAYGDPRFWPVQDAARFRHHLQSMGRLTVDLLAAGHQVVLFTTDGPDRLALREMQADLTPALTAEQRERLRVADTPGVTELLALLGRLDLVIAARFHGVLLAHVQGTPALAIAHERKVATLMDDMGQSRFCFPIDGFDPDQARARLTELEASRHDLAAAIRTRVAEYRRQVHQQYDQVLGAARAAEVRSA